MGLKKRKEAHNKRQEASARRVALHIAMMTFNKDNVVVNQPCMLLSAKQEV